jgi:hypothetical protein
MGELRCREEDVVLEDDHGVIVAQPRALSPSTEGGLTEGASIRRDSGIGTGNQQFLKTG